MVGHDASGDIERQHIGSRASITSVEAFLPADDASAAILRNRAAQRTSALADR